ncbi:hypothetical protein HBH46_250040, partial [Parastagonospora nodorum]
IVAKKRKLVPACGKSIQKPVSWTKNYRIFSSTLSNASRARHRPDNFEKISFSLD